MAKKESKKQKNKNKRLETKTQELGDFLQDHGIRQQNVIEVVTESGATKVIDIGEVPLAPKAHFEQVIDADILEKGPPFNIIVKNVNYDATVDEVIEHFGGIKLTVQNKPSNDFSGMGNNHRRGDFIFVVYNEDDLRASLEKDGTRLNNREIVVEILKPGAKLYERGNYFSSSRQQNISRYKMMMDDNANGDEIGDWKAGKEKFINQHGYKSYSGNQRQNRFDTSNFRVDTPNDGDWRAARDDFQANNFDNTRNKTERSSNRTRYDDSDLPNNWVSAKLDFQKEQQSSSTQRHTDCSIPLNWKAAKEDFQRNISKSDKIKNNHHKGDGGVGGYDNTSNRRSTSPYGNHREKHHRPIESDQVNELMTSSWINKKNEFQNDPSSNNSNSYHQHKNDDYVRAFNNNHKKYNPKNLKFRPTNEQEKFNQQKSKSKPGSSSVVLNDNGVWLKHPGM